MFVPDFPPAAIVVDYQERPFSALPPVCSVSFETPDLIVYRGEFEKGEGTQFCEDLGECWVLSEPGKSFIRLTFDLSIVLDLPYTLYLNQAFSKHGEASITIRINGRSIAQGEKPRAQFFETYELDATGFLKKGRNELLIEVDGGSSAKYCIRNLSLQAEFNPFK